MLKLIFSRSILFFLCLSFLSVAQASESTKVVVMGDSLSAAYRLPVEQGWVALMDDQLDKSKTPVSIINLSISGATTAAGLKILPQALEAHKPTLVILALGANDGLQGKPIAYIKGNLDKLIQLSKGIGAEVLLMGVRIPPNYGSAYTEPFFNQYKQLSEQHDTYLVPFFLEGAAGNMELMMDDGKHPNAKGQEVVLANVLPSVQNILRDLSELKSR